jgi:hypothetical protein
MLLCEQEYRDIKKLSERLLHNSKWCLFTWYNLRTEGKVIYKANFIFKNSSQKKGIENLIRAWGDIKDDNWKLTIVYVDENG